MALSPVNGVTHQMTNHKMQCLQQSVCAMRSATGSRWEIMTTLVMALEAKTEVKKGH